jgi:hypothetical protein
MKRKHDKPRVKRAVPAHPRSVSLLPETEMSPAPDQPFAEGVEDVLSPDLRHRLVSEVAFHHLAERGYADGGELDDWAQAADEVDHTLLDREKRGGS